MTSEMVLEASVRSGPAETAGRKLRLASVLKLRRSTGSGIPRVGLFIESSRASGRSLLGGVARYVHDRGRWLALVFRRFFG